MKHNKIRVIIPFSKKSYFQFKYRKLQDESIDDIVKVILLMKKQLSIKKVLKFIKYNSSCLNVLLMVLPVNMIIQLYHEYNLLKNYWDEKLTQYLFSIANKKMQIKLANYLFKSSSSPNMVEIEEEITTKGNNYANSFNYLDEIIIMNDMISGKYNFTNKVIEKRLNIMKQKISLKLDDYYLGKNFVLFLGDSELFRAEKYPIFKIYSKRKKCELGSGGKVYINKINNRKNIVYSHNEIIIIIDQYSYDTKEALISNKIDLFYDDKKIYVLPSIYQKIAENDNYIIDNYNSYLNIGKVWPWMHIKLTSFDIKKMKSMIMSNKLVKCYVCKKFFDENITLERYNIMCLDCAYYNYEKREKMADLNNFKIFVTGIRQKIGFEMALILLRCGATVYGTTRFPNMTAYNYKSQHDYDKWKDRLHILKCNFTNLAELNKIIDYLKDKELNAIINNACQTIRPSKTYANKVLTFEKQLYLNKICWNDVNDDNENKETRQIENNNIVINNYFDSTYQLALTQPDYNHKNFGYDNNKIVNIMKNEQIYLNQFHDIKDIDIKESSSWNKKIDDIDKGEILEATIINQIAPTLIINQLKSTMDVSERKHGFIINVTALEGRFNYRYGNAKNEFHAHTNMCKAAMNMLIRTLSEEKGSNIRVHAIDPGFVSGVNPQSDYYPLSAKDGAARILYPIINYYNNEGLPIDKKWISMRDYLPTTW